MQTTDLSDLFKVICLMSIRILIESRSPDFQSSVFLLHYAAGYIIYFAFIIHYLVVLFIFLDTYYVLVVQEAVEEFPRGIVDKNLPANARDKGSIPGQGRFHMLQSN